MPNIDKYYCLSECGLRAINEDHLAISHDEQTFIVCDGVGGSGHGDIASQIVAHAFADNFHTSSYMTADEVLKHSEQMLTQHGLKYPTTKDMATTMAMVRFRKETIHVSWCGDSRVYFFRKGELKRVTIDHSWVSEALQAGKITAKQAKSHPYAHVITRSVKGQDDPTFLDEFVIDEIQDGDMLLLCTDGIMEACSNSGLSMLFRQYDDPKVIIKKIEEQCNIYSTDNFTAIVIKIII